MDTKWYERNGLTGTCHKIYPMVETFLVGVKKDALIVTFPTNVLEHSQTREDRIRIQKLAQSDIIQKVSVPLGTYFPLGFL